jgi:hypothetical protein
LEARANDGQEVELVCRDKEMAAPASSNSIARPRSSKLPTKAKHSFSQAHRMFAQKPTATPP